LQNDEQQKRTRQKPRLSHTAVPPQAQAACSKCLRYQPRCTPQQQQTQQRQLLGEALTQLLLLLLLWLLLI
jgi:hypothetical protein